MPHITTPSNGLTSGEANFIESVRFEGKLYIEQPYELYSEENHEVWRRLYARMLPRWERYANPHFRRLAVQAIGPRKDLSSAER